jgi:hypothetical protein
MDGGLPEIKMLARRELEKCLLAGWCEPAKEKAQGFFCK